jgi:hypothetical protein
MKAGDIYRCMGRLESCKGMCFNCKKNDDCTARHGCKKKSECFVRLLELGSYGDEDIWKVLIVNNPEKRGLESNCKCEENKLVKPTIEELLDI